MGWLYVALVLLRLFSVFAPGYIHVDEYFQNQEVMCGWNYGYDTHTTWEWSPDKPVRSPSALFLASGFVFWTLKKISDVSWFYLGIDLDNSLLSTPVLMFAPRIWFFLFTLLVDYAAVRVAKKLDLDPSAALAAVNVSWANAIQIRGFANGTEHLVLIWGIYILVTKDTTRPAVVRLLGAILGIGTHLRFTLPFFYAPIVLNLVTEAARLHKPTSRKLKAACWVLWYGFTGFLPLFVMGILLDSFYFGSLFILGPDGAPMGAQQALNRLVRGDVAGLLTGVRGTPTVSLLNMFNYSTNFDNLRSHGTHGRWMHSCVNIFIMYGPLAVFAYCKAYGILRDGWYSGALKERFRRIATLKATVMMTAFSGMLVLSAAPHAEARFLLPMLFPLAVLFGQHVSGPKASRVVKFSWVAFNMAMFVYFGYLHHAALLPAAIREEHVMVKPTRESAMCAEDLVAYTSAATAGLSLPALPAVCEKFLPMIRSINVYHIIYAGVYMRPRFTLRARKEPEFTPQGWRLVTHQVHTDPAVALTAVPASRRVTQAVSKQIAARLGGPTTLNVVEVVSLGHTWQDPIKSGMLADAPNDVDESFRGSFNLSDDDGEVQILWPMLLSEMLPTLDEPERANFYIRTSTTRFDNIRVTP